MHIGHEVEKFLRRSNMAPSRFGQLAIGDPCLVTDLRNGREPRSRVSGRILDFIANQDAGA